MKRFILLLYTVAFFTLANGQGVVTFEFSDGIEPSALKTKMERQASALLTAINKAAASGSDIDFSGIDIDPTAAQDLSNTWETVRFSTEENDIMERCTSRKTNSGSPCGFQVRNIGMNIHPLSEIYDGPLRRELAIDFDADGKIEDLNFTLDDYIEYGNLMREGMELGDMQKRSQILLWCEKFKNAFSQRDIGFLERLLSDDPVILTGKTENERYKVEGKTEYLDKLSRVFRTARQINAKTYNHKIVRHASRPNYYGVTFNMDWSTDKYGDKGIVFLIWDFSNEDEPKIPVFTWTPSTEETEDVFSFDNFYLP